MDTPPLPDRLGGAWTALRQFLYGLTGCEFSRHALAMRHEMEAVFMVVMLGDLTGVPILPPIYGPLRGGRRLIA